MTGQTAGWKAVGAPYDGGDVGGDSQCGKSWAIRYHNDDLPHAVIDVYVYPTAIETSAGTEYSIETMYEWTICTDRSDTGGTEEWADIEYDGGVLAYGSQEDAERAAREAANNMLHNFTPEWNGLRPAGRAQL